LDVGDNRHEAVVGGPSVEVAGPPGPPTTADPEHRPPEGPDGGNTTSGRLGEELRAFEGRRVSVALSDRSCIEDAVLESATQGGLWLYSEGDDVFVAAKDVLDVWENR